MVKKFTNHKSCSRHRLQKFHEKNTWLISSVIEHKVKTAGIGYGMCKQDLISQGERQSVNAIPQI